MTTDERLLINTLRALSLCHTYALCTDKACNLGGDSCAEHRAALVDRVGPRLAQTVLETCADIVTIKAVGAQEWDDRCVAKAKQIRAALEIAAFEICEPDDSPTEKDEAMRFGGKKIPMSDTNSTSSVREYRSCRRRYRYKYIDRIRPITKSAALNVGSGTHVGLEHFMGGEPLDGVLAAVDEYCIADWWHTEKGRVEKARTRAMLRAYYARWADDRRDWETVEVEGQFDIELVSTSQFVGKKDALMRYRPTGKLFLWEHKTTSDDVSTVGADFWQRLALDSQTTVYRQSVATTHGELPGVIYDVIRKPMGKPRMKTKVAKRKSETAEEFERRKTDAYETIDEFEQRLVDELPTDYLIRREIFKTRQDTDSVLAELRETIAEMDAYQGSYPRNDSACKSFGTTCPYLGVCVGAESLDSPRFEHSQNKHPEISGTTNQGDADDDVYESCPL